ncbi:MAG: 50S ribosomal protein L10 [Terriglobia bacterium]
MAKKRSQKDKEIEQLHGELLGVTSLVLSTFSGLTVEQETELRRQVQATGGNYQVVKNTLATRAARGTPAEPLLTGLTGVNSIAYTAGDPVALAKTLTKYAKENPAFIFRAGLVEGRVLSLEEIHALAALPTREELFSRLLFLFQAPAQWLARAVAAASRNLTLVLKQAHDEKKFSQAASPEAEVTS